jgi:hypothetical protein
MTNTIPAANGSKLRPKRRGRTTGPELARTGTDAGPGE